MCNGMICSPFTAVPPRVVAISPRQSFVLWDQSVTLQFNETSALPLINPDRLIWQFQRAGSTVMSTLIGDASHVFSSNRRSLTITNVRLSDEGVYRLTAENAAGTSTDFINLTIYGNKQLCIYCLFDHYFFCSFTRGAT